MFERFTAAARETVINARITAQQLNHAKVGTEHLLLALLSEETDIAATVLRQAGLDRAQVRSDVVRLTDGQSQILGDEDAAALRTIGIDLDAVLARIEESLGPEALAVPPPATPRRERLWPWQRASQGGESKVSKLGPGFTPRAKKTLELALREALHLRHRHIGTEHILLGLLRDDAGLSATVLAEAGVTTEALRAATLAELARQPEVGTR
ncbi:Clp protease N-terminal domain-containing protein [Micromonospora polyrhachis]|uniref:ATP-dependent Clp protease ATP-binding subunit ClpA n=1 Tax=Micromonospora polyrhachis TaxID=1282883 RepID=A0A7W7SMQ0_9ACTN|nr:Clp protease N-terminal domain-containing protein [Micromonospora polyrhachis]MBB4957623.1 ATP-dependent Clp protease ATP-binding subunit ClpA [Micromonospora polyrhachis]